MADTGNYESADEQLQSFVNVMEQHRGMRGVIEDPSLSRTEKVKFIQEVCELLGLEETLQGLLLLLIQKERFGALADIARSYRRIYKERLGLLEVKVRSVIPLREDQLERISQLVHAMTGKTAEVKQVRDHSLLGGLIVQMGNTVLDGSIKNHLERIRRSLVRQQPKGERTV